VAGTVVITAAALPGAARTQFTVSAVMTGGAPGTVYDHQNSLLRHSWVQGRRDHDCGILATMPELITQPSRVAAAGQPPKLIDEYVGRANTGQDGLSIAHMRSPSGWSEPGQRPEFDEFTIVLRGSLVVESEGDQVTVQAGQGVHTRPGEWVRYSSPGADGAEYISVCVPAFAPDTVHRDA